MSSVVNVNAIRTRFIQLGWENLSISDVVDGLTKAAIGASEFIAYLDALTASTGGMDDQTIAGCAPADATKITTYLKSHGAVTV